MIRTCGYWIGMMALTAIAACGGSGSSSPVSPSSTTAPVASTVTAYSGMATILVNNSPTTGRFDITTTTTSSLLASLIAPQATSGTVTGTLTPTTGSPLPVTGTVSGSAISLQVAGQSLSMTSNTDGSISGSGNTYAVSAFSATASTQPGRFAGTYSSNNQTYNASVNRVIFDTSDGPINFVISGTPYATGRYYVSGYVVDTSNPGVTYTIWFAGTAVLPFSSDTPSKLSAGSFLDVHTTNMVLPINMDGNYIGDHWGGGFSGGNANAAQGYTTGVFSAYGPR